MHYFFSDILHFSPFSFSLQRIRKNLTVGIAAWVPIMPFKRVIIDFPHNDLSQSVRSICIRNVLERMLEYCGVEVSSRMRNRKVK